MLPIIERWDERRTVEGPTIEVLYVVVCEGNAWRQFRAFWADGAEHSAGSLQGGTVPGYATAKEARRQSLHWRRERLACIYANADRQRRALVAEIQALVGKEQNDIHTS